MKILQTTLFFVLISFSLSSQDKAIEFEKWAVGINFSPDYCYRTLKYDGPDERAHITIEGRNNNEIAKIGYTTGINASYFFKQNLALEFGINYSNKGYKTKMTEMTFGAGPMMGAGDITSDRSGFVYNMAEMPKSIEIIYSYQYIDLPLKMNYLIGKRKIRLITSAGIVTNIFITEKTVSRQQYEDGDIKSGEPSKSRFGYKAINLSAMVSVGTDIKLGERFNLRIEPTYRYGLLNIRTSKNDMQGYLWNSGLNLGLYYKL